MPPLIACHRTQFPAAVLGLAVLVSFTCAHAAEQDWTTVDADRQEVDMYVPGMSTWRPGYGKRIYGDRYAGTGVLYYTKWGGLLSDKPIAYLTHQEMRKRFRYTRLTEAINLFMGTSYTTKANVLSLNSDTSKHGGFKYIKFDIQTPSKIRSCVGFKRQSAGNKEYTYGHYCLPNEGEITFKTISQIIDSITIHGTASEPDQNVLEQRLQKMQTVNERDDKNVCALGLTDNREAPSWDNRTRWRKYANEAKRRDFTPQGCAKLLGWKTVSSEKKLSEDGDIEKRLTKLKNLFEKGLISKDEYEKKRSEILEAL